MFRSSFLMLTILMILSVHGKNSASRKRLLSSTTTTTRKPTSIKLCGLALVQMLDMICNRARQLLLKAERSSYEKREIITDNDPFTQTLWVKDYAQFNNTLVGDCCLQACTLKILLQYC